MNLIRAGTPAVYHNYIKAAAGLQGNSLVVGFPEGEDLAREMADRPEQKYLESLLKEFSRENGGFL